MKITADQVRGVAPRAATSASLIADALGPAMAKFRINTRLRAVHFLGQLIEESGEFTRTRENMNYSAERLMAVWPSRFKTMAHAQGFAHMPEALGNLVYANRMGNGDMASGDGYRYRGGGWGQITGKEIQLECADYFDLHPSVIGQWLATPQGAALSAAWYWNKRDINRYADMDDVDGVSDAFNLGRQTEKYGDAIGFNKRLMHTQMCKKVIT